MKRLAVLCVLAAVLGVCSQSYGYVLVYDIWGMAKAVDVTTNEMNRTVVRGILVVDIDEEQGFATEAKLVLFHRENGQGTYTVSEAVGLGIYGNSVAAVMDTGWMGGQIILTGSMGRMWGRNIGLADRKNVANAMDGSLHLNGSVLFDPQEALVGAGMMTATLDLQDTREANGNAESVSTVVDDFVLRLQNRGFVELSMEEPMPT